MVGEVFAEEKAIAAQLQSGEHALIREVVLKWVLSLFK